MKLNLICIGKRLTAQQIKNRQIWTFGIFSFLSKIPKNLVGMSNFFLALDKTALAVDHQNLSRTLCTCRTLTATDSVSI